MELLDIMIEAPGSEEVLFLLLSIKCWKTTKCGGIALCLQKAIEQTSKE